ncbi:hypothetical protein BDY17DRAFT_319638 [Neohortaea acidophila]|uniref:Uncharacterized protein n=1 Tax=Neohortaea acidophila TaxID=245834 RepID=A0A6A6Q3T8_9PEZI|nr:uncharacterized protein BDY17DRAFT_319638 [Neohortaea acidophila]KAF2487070.1 hypothetical protein BDY17DRAFT_319638 [Neohortaea acidophila]
MSSSAVPIPQRKRNAVAAASYSSSASSSWSVGLGTPHSSSSKGKEPMSTSPPSSSSPSWSSMVEPISPRRPSLLGSSLAKSEHTVINLAHSDGPPRLVTCVKSSQGFDWNPELFLPSYAYQTTLDLATKQDPVEDIVLTDEEAAAILPQ